MTLSQTNPTDTFSQKNKVLTFLGSLDHDLSSFQHILRHHQQLKSQYSEPKTLELKRKFQNEQISKMSSTSTPKWPVFDDPIEETSKIPTKSEEKTSYQKNFAYHKVTGKPAHLKKYPSAYIAVSAISPRPAQSEENFLLESELHRLKPWKNKYERKE
ncbi:hypothetical protein ABEB36_002275 [Hypothenemus hampei]|uniref:Uncharacterized protein n=1 Tax=Hypothenemus hampei TaxID=57062 RepID=A0ABD1F7R5_HYPHA